MVNENIPTSQSIRESFSSAETQTVVDSLKPTSRKVGMWKREQSQLETIVPLNQPILNCITPSNRTVSRVDALIIAHNCIPNTPENRQKFLLVREVVNSFIQENCSYAVVQALKANYPDNYGDKDEKTIIAEIVDEKGKVSSGKLPTNFSDKVPNLSLFLDQREEIGKPENKRKETPLKQIVDTVFSKVEEKLPPTQPVEQPLPLPEKSKVIEYIKANTDLSSKITTALDPKQRQKDTWQEEQKQLDSSLSPLDKPIKDCITPQNRTLSRVDALIMAKGVIPTNPQDKERFLLIRNLVDHYLITNHSYAVAQALRANYPQSFPSTMTDKQIEQQTNGYTQLPDDFTTKVPNLTLFLDQREEIGKPANTRKETPLNKLIDSLISAVDKASRPEISTGSLVEAAGVGETEKNKGYLQFVMDHIDDVQIADCLRQELTLNETSGKPQLTDTVTLKIYLEQLQQNPDSPESIAFIKAFIVTEEDLAKKEDRVMNCWDDDKEQERDDIPTIGEMEKTPRFHPDRHREKGGHWRVDQGIKFIPSIDKTFEMFEVMSPSQERAPLVVFGQAKNFTQVYVGKNAAVCFDNLDNYMLGTASDNVRVLGQIQNANVILENDAQVELADAAGKKSHIEVYDRAVATLSFAEKTTADGTEITINSSGAVYLRNLPDQIKRLMLGFGFSDAGYFVICNNEDDYYTMKNGIREGKITAVNNDALDKNRLVYIDQTPEQAESKTIREDNNSITVQSYSKNGIKFRQQESDFVLLRLSPPRYISEDEQNNRYGLFREERDAAGQTKLQLVVAGEVNELNNSLIRKGFGLTITEIVPAYSFEQDVNLSPGAKKFISAWIVRTNSQAEFEKTPLKRSQVNALIGEIQAAKGSFDEDGQLSFAAITNDTLKQSKRFKQIPEQLRPWQVAEKDGKVEIRVAVPIATVNNIEIGKRTERDVDKNVSVSFVEIREIKQMTVEKEQELQIEKCGQVSQTDVRGKLTLSELTGQLDEVNLTGWTGAELVILKPSWPGIEDRINKLSYEKRHNHKLTVYDEQRRPITLKLYTYYGTSDKSDTVDISSEELRIKLKKEHDELYKPILSPAASPPPQPPSSPPAPASPPSPGPVPPPGGEAAVTVEAARKAEEYGVSHGGAEIDLRFAEPKLPAKEVKTSGVWLEKGGGCFLNCTDCILYLQRNTGYGGFDFAHTNNFGNRVIIPEDEGGGGHNAVLQNNTYHFGCLKRGLHRYSDEEGSAPVCFVETFDMGSDRSLYPEDLLLCVQQSTELPSNNIIKDEQRRHIYIIPDLPDAVMAPKTVGFTTGDDEISYYSYEDKSDNNYFHTYTIIKGENQVGGKSVFIFERTKVTDQAGEISYKWFLAGGFEADDQAPQTRPSTIDWNEASLVAWLGPLMVETVEDAEKYGISHGGAVVDWGKAVIRFPYQARYRKRSLPKGNVAVLNVNGNVTIDSDHNPMLVSRTFEKEAGESNYRAKLIIRGDARCVNLTSENHNNFGDPHLVFGDAVIHFNFPTNDIEVEEEGTKGALLYIGDVGKITSTFATLERIQTKNNTIIVSTEDQFTEVLEKTDQEKAVYAIPTFPSAREMDNDGSVADGEFRYLGVSDETDFRHVYLVSEGTNSEGKKATFVFEQTTFIDGEKTEKRWILLTGAKEDKMIDLTERIKGKPWGTDKVIAAINQVVFPPPAVPELEVVALPGAREAERIAAEMLALRPIAQPPPPIPAAPPPPQPPPSAPSAEAVEAVLPVETLAVDLKKGVIDLRKFPTEGVRQDGGTLVVGNSEKVVVDSDNVKLVVVSGNVPHISFWVDEKTHLESARLIVADGSVSEMVNVAVDNKKVADYCGTPAEEISINGNGTVVFEKTGTNFKLNISREAIAGVEVDCLVKIPKDAIDHPEKVYGYFLPSCDKLSDEVGVVHSLDYTQGGETRREKLHYVVKDGNNLRHFTLVTGQNTTTKRQALFVFERMTIIDREGASTMRWVLVDGREQGDHTLEQKIKDKTGIETDKLIGLNQEITKRLNEIQAEYQVIIDRDGEPFSELEKQGLNKLIEATGKYYIGAGTEAQITLNKRIDVVLKTKFPDWQKNLTNTVEKAVLSGEMTRHEVEKLLSAFATADEKAPCVITLKPENLGVAMEISNAPKTNTLVNDPWLSMIDSDVNSVQAYYVKVKGLDSFVVIGDKCGYLSEVNYAKIGQSMQRQVFGQPARQPPTQIFQANKLEVTAEATVREIVNLSGENIISGQAGVVAQLKDNGTINMKNRGRVIVEQCGTGTNLVGESKGKILVLTPGRIISTVNLKDGAMVANVTVFSAKTLGEYFDQHHPQVMLPNQTVILPSAQSMPSAFVFNDEKYEVVACQVVGADKETKPGFALVRYDSKQKSVYLEDIWTEAKKTVRVGDEEFTFCTRELYDRENSPEKQQLFRAVDVIKEQMKDWLFPAGQNVADGILARRDSSIRQELIKMELLGENQLLDKAWFESLKYEETTMGTSQLEKALQYCLPLDAYDKILHSIRIFYDRETRQPIVKITVSGSGAYKNNEYVSLDPFTPPPSSSIIWELELEGKIQNHLLADGKKPITIRSATDVLITKHPKIKSIEKISGGIMLFDCQVGEILDAVYGSSLSCHGETRINFLGQGCRDISLWVRRGSNVTANFPIVRGDIDADSAVFSFGQAPDGQSERTYQGGTDRFQGREYIMYWDIDYHQLVEQVEQVFQDRRLLRISRDRKLTLPDKPYELVGFKTADDEKYCVVKVPREIDGKMTETYIIISVDQTRDGQKRLRLEGSHLYRRNKVNQKLQWKKPGVLSSTEIGVKHGSVRYQGAVVIPENLSETQRNVDMKSLWETARAVSVVNFKVSIANEKAGVFFFNLSGNGSVTMASYTEGNRLIIPECRGSVEINNNNIVSIGQLAGKITLKDRAKAFVSNVEVGESEKRKIHLESDDAVVVVTKKSLAKITASEFLIKEKTFTKKIIDQILITDDLPDENDPRDLIKIRDGDYDRQFKLQWASKRNGDRVMCVFEQVMEIPVTGGDVKYHWAMVDVDSEDNYQQFNTRLSQSTGVSVDGLKSLTEQIDKNCRQESTKRQSVENIMRTLQFSHKTPTNTILLYRKWVSLVKQDAANLITDDKLSEIAQAVIEDTTKTPPKAFFGIGSEKVAQYEAVLAILNKISITQIGEDLNIIAAKIAAVLKTDLSGQEITKEQLKMLIGITYDLVRHFV